MAQNKPQGDKPTLEFICWPFKLAIWERQKSENGRTFTERTAALTKSFKRQGSDKYEEQKISLFADDVGKLMILLNTAAGAMCVDTRTP